MRATEALGVRAPIDRLGGRLALELRSWASLAPLVGLVPRPEDRPNGISALVRVRGEEEWIEPCLRSIAEFADEILVFDNGAGEATSHTLDRLASALGDRLIVERCPGLDLFAVSNLGLGRARYRWCVRWDADFVAHTTGAGDIMNLRRDLLLLDTRRYHLVYVTAAEVAGDLHHQVRDMRLRSDGQAVVWSAALRYAAVSRRVRTSRLGTHDRVLRRDREVRRTLESLHTPRYYRVVRWPTPAYFHVNVKSGRHMLLRHFWLEWLDAVRRGASSSQEAYVEERTRREWGVAGLEEAERLYVAEYCRMLSPFDPAVSGPYPALLSPYLDHPAYGVEYRGGEIVGRRERG